MKKLVLLIFMFSVSIAIGQLKVGNNAKMINPNSLFEMESNNKGMLLPRLALVATDSTKPLTAHIQGMIVYNLSNSGIGNKAVSPGYYYNDGTQWVRILGSVSSSNTTAGQLVTVTNGTGATLTNMQVGLDTTALKTFVNGRTTVSNVFNTSTRALTTTVNGVASNAVVINTNDSTSASNGLTLTGKDVRLGGTLTMPTTLTQGSNLMTFTGAPGVGNTGIINMTNTATGANGTVVLDMLTPNSDVSYYRIGKSNTTGNSSEITFRTVGNNSDSNSLSLGFFGSQYLINLTKNGNLGVGTNLFVPTQKLDVDGGARIRSLASGANSDSIVTVDGTGVLRRRSLSAVVSGDNWGSQTVAVSTPLTGNGTSGSPLNITRANATAANNLVTVTNGTNATFTAMTVGVDTTNLKSFLNNNVTVSSSAPLTGNGTSGSPLNITRANTTAANNLVTVTNGTNATFTSMTVGVDTTNLKSFLNNNVTVSSSAPLTGNGTSGSPLSIASNNTTAGQLVTVTNGMGASLTNMQVGVDTTALKTFVNGRTTVSNAFNTSTRALTTTVNGIASNAVTITTTNDSTTASNGLTLNGKDLRLGGTLNTATTINQGANILTFNATPTIDFTAGININNNATGNAGSTVLNMISPNTDSSFFRIGKLISTGNVAEISYTHRGSNNDTNRLSFGFHSSRYLLNLMKNGNLSVGNIIASEKLDVDGGARIRSLASGANSDSIVTVDGTGVLRRRSLSAVVSGDNWGSQTVAVSAPLTGNGTSGSPLNITRANTSAANNLVTVTNGTNATFTAMTVGVDTTNLKSFLNNNVTVSSSAPLTGNGTSGSPLNITRANTTAANNLVTVTNGTNATFTAMTVGVDTTNLKSFINARTTNTLTASSNAITNSTNGIVATLTPSAGTLTTKFLGFDASGNLVTDSAVTTATEPWMVQGGTIQATSNTQNIYQTGTVAIGKNAVYNDANTQNVRLDVEGNMHVGGNDTSNYIAFKGITGDNPSAYDHAYLGVRKFGGTENSEMVIFKGDNNSTSTTGTDRIRVLSGELQFQTYTNDVSGSFESVSRSILDTTRMIIRTDGNVGIGTLSPTSLLDVNGTVRIRTLNSGASSDSIVTSDANGVLRRRSATSVISSGTTVSNAFNTSTRALTTSVNGITSNAVTIPTTNDSTTASNGLNINGKDIRLGGTLNTATTITQGTNLLTFTGTPSSANTGVITLSNTATGSNGTVLLDMLTPNSNVSYFRLGRETAFGNSAEITYRHIGNNNDSNSLSLGFFNSQHLVNLTKNGNLGIGANLFVPTQKLDVDGGARIRNLASGANSDSIVTVDGTGVLRRRNLNAFVSNIYNTDGTLTGERTLTNNGNVLNFQGNGGSGFPLRLRSGTTTSSEVTLGIYDRSSSDSRGWMIGSNTYNGVANSNGGNSRELHFSNLGFTNPGVKMKIDTLGNVAIGRNTDATVRLAVQGGIAVGNGNFAIDSAYVQDNNFVTFRHNGTSEDFIGYRNNTFYFADCPGGSDVTNPNVMVLGNLGVGNTTPAARLHVTGNARITSMSLGAATDSIVVVDANGELKKRASNSVASSNQISASVSASVPAMSIGDAGIVNLTVTGAAVGDVVIVNPTSDLPAGVVIAYSRVSAANTVRVGFTGTGSSGAFSQTFDIKVIK